MALVKRGKTWHTDFSVGGQRFRQSLETTDWRKAQAKQTELIAEAKARKLAPTAQQFAKLGFHEAGNRYLDGRKLELAAASLKKERQLLVQPERFFGSQCLHKITTEDLLAYREWRVKSGCRPRHYQYGAGGHPTPAEEGKEMAACRR